MIGRITLLWVGLAAGAATGLFQLKYEVQALEGKIARTNRAILADQQAIHVLKAEWAYFNQPAELGKRALVNLNLKTLAVGQIGLIADLPLREGAAAPAAGYGPIPIPVPVEPTFTPLVADLHARP